MEWDIYHSVGPPGLQDLIHLEAELKTPSFVKVKERALVIMVTLLPQAR